MMASSRLRLALPSTRLLIGHDVRMFSEAINRWEGAHRRQLPDCFTGLLTSTRSTNWTKCLCTINDDKKTVQINYCQFIIYCCCSVVFGTALSLYCWEIMKSPGSGFFIFMIRNFCKNKDQPFGSTAAFSGLPTKPGKLDGRCLQGDEAIERMWAEFIKFGHDAGWYMGSCSNSLLFRCRFASRIPE